ncbi:MAG: hypothetical protein KatS3mg077_0958 [Candidatus Binatia bacterium]|nr:MAG: hypothetical protein KatS3mg077_0958 [Candidatus Binatia bacterium]
MVGEGVGVAEATVVVELGGDESGVPPGVGDVVGETAGRSEGVGLAVARTVPRGVRVKVGVRVGRGVAASMVLVNHAHVTATHTAHNAEPDGQRRDGLSCRDLMCCTGGRLQRGFRICNPKNYSFERFTPLRTPRPLYRRRGRVGCAIPRWHAAPG